MRLNSKVALVTGGNRGIGKGIVLALAQSGAKVALTYCRNSEQAEQVMARIKANNGRAMASQMDVNKRSSVESVIAEIKSRFGTIDILINNAAIAQEKRFAAITDEDWDAMQEVNLRGPFITCQLILPDMVQQNWGRIVNITSIGGQWGGFNQVHYAASKAGLISLTRSLARIYSRFGITINAVAPGLVLTDMSANELDSNAGKEKVRNIPIGRIAAVKEVADAVKFLASDAASYITGQTININGGMYFG